MLEITGDPNDEDAYLPEEAKAQFEKIELTEKKRQVYEDFHPFWMRFRFQRML
jgi:hypothetical protein